MKKLIFLSAICLLLIGCYDEESFFFKNNKESLTVEAYVELDKAPIVYLTTGLSVNGFSDIDILKSIESTAKVEIFDGENSEIATFSSDDSKFPSRFYTFDNIKGKKDTNYELKITIDNEEYTSSTIVPKKPILQSISYVKKSTLDEGIYNIKINLENPTTDSYYKLYIKNVHENYFEKASVFVISNNLVNDDILTVFIDYWYYEDNINKVSILEPNNTYDIKIVSINKDEFLFWQKVFGSQIQIESLPSLTQEIPTNITNNAFGFFSGNSEIFTQITIGE